MTTSFSVTKPASRLGLAALAGCLAMALVAGGRARSGQTLYVPSPAGEAAVQVTGAVFYDPSGARINA